MLTFLRQTAAALPLGLAVLFAVPKAAFAQPSSKEATATRVSGRAPTIDGRLDDAAWRSGQLIDDFIQKRPIEASAPSGRTEVRLLYDDEALYVGARMLSAEPGTIPATVTRRDNFSDTEIIVVSLDTYLDRRTAYTMGISSGGVRVDFFNSRDSEHDGRQYQFDPVWDARARLDSTGWTAEFRIPFSQLRFNAAPAQVWGLNIKRWIPRNNEDIYWVMVPSTETGYISRFGTLRGIDGIRPTRPIEIVPYVAGAATRRANVHPRDPFHNPYDGRVGADAKFGIGSNLTLDATVNPDFGQVEADPAEVNLTAFETFFNERRPFFTEGGSALNGSVGPAYFYSRRVGAPPHVQPTAHFVDAPSASTILGAAKLTGRLASGMSIGTLVSVTRAERARTFDTTTTAQFRVPVEPTTTYALVRAQQEIGRQASTVGATLTAVQRDLGGDSAITSVLTKRAVTGGADMRLRFKEGMYELTGFAGFSHVEGDSLAIARLQNSSSRYFQRPDVDYLELDSTRRSLNGYTAMLRAGKNAGRRVLWGAQITAESPGFELNDMGRVQSVDGIDYNADVQVRETMPGRLLRDWRLGFSTNGGWNYGGDRQHNRFSQATSINFLNFWSFNVWTELALPAQSFGLTRGGPSMSTPRRLYQEWRLSNSFAARTQWRLNTSFARDDLDGWMLRGGGGFSMRPGPQWQFSVDPGWVREVNARQYVTSLEDGLPATFGRRYIFGRIDRSTLSARFRLNYAFSPDLTFEGYAEPFAASGHYYDLGELAAPRGNDLRVYSAITPVTDETYSVTDGGKTFEVPNGNFNLTSFRSNAVLRWEWLPGSTFYLVWQQNRAARFPLGDRARARDLWDSVHRAGDHFLLVKVSYWRPVSS